MTFDSHTNILIMVVAILCMTIMMIIFDEDENDDCFLKLIINISHAHNLVAENSLA